MSGEEQMPDPDFMNGLIEQNMDYLRTFQYNKKAAGR